VTTTPRVLLDDARDLVERAGAGPVGVWPRAAALLGRRAIEEALDRLWAKRAPGMERASARAQLACLPDYVSDRTLAADVAYAWASLSRACHHHSYELAPTASELQTHLAVVDRLIEYVERTVERLADAALR
jgi:hypothetical protein